ncbi:MAG: hypothetical protein HY927_07995 [Elusimicrobia bacterium]|nr:hypothetical protein [Elusimicrobiota bacterium]
MTEAEARAYLKKAEEFYQAMLESYRERRWNAAGLEGVHCAISATDALLGLKARVRAAGESHYEAVDLVRAHIKHEHVDQQAARLSRVISKKNIVEYDSRDFKNEEAAAIVKDVGRYLEWVKALFHGHS